MLRSLDLLLSCYNDLLKMILSYALDIRLGLEFFFLVFISHIQPKLLAIA